MAKHKPILDQSHRAERKWGPAPVKTPDGAYELVVSRSTKQRYWSGKTPGDSWYLEEQAELGWGFQRTSKPDAKVQSKRWYNVVTKQKSATKPTRGGAQEVDTDAISASDIEQNRHCWQAKGTEHVNPPNPGALYRSRTDMKFQSDLAADAPRRKYQRRKEQVKTVVQWEQRSRHLVELEFLAVKSEPKRRQTVLYVGAAPGLHVWKLAQMMPNLDFVLIDPLPFHRTVMGKSNIEVKQCEFTDALARKYAAKPGALAPLLICDFDCAKPGMVEDARRSENCDPAEMMRLQRRWHALVRPASSLLRLALPWTDSSSQYLKGVLLIPPFAAATSAELRLMTDAFASATAPAEMRAYEHRKLEEQMFYFNTETRVARYGRARFYNYASSKSLHSCCCYDCTKEAVVLTMFLEKYAPQWRALSEGARRATLRKFVNDFNGACSPDGLYRTLAHATEESARAYPPHRAPPAAAGSRASGGGAGVFLFSFNRHILANPADNVTAPLIF